MDTTYFLHYSAARRKLFTQRHIAFLLLGLDILLLPLCLQFSSQFRINQTIDISNPAIYGFSLVTLLAFYIFEAYRPDSQKAGLRAPARILLASGAIIGLTAIYIYLSGSWGKNPFFGRGVWLPGLLLFTLWAIASRMAIVQWVRAHVQQQRWLILGAGERISPLIQDMRDRQLLGQVYILKSNSKSIDSSSPILSPAKSRNLALEEPEPLCDTDPTLTHLNDLTDLPNWISQNWSGIVVATPDQLAIDLKQYLMQIRLRGIPIYGLPNFYENFWYKLPSDLLHDGWFAFNSGFDLVPGSINQRLKRVIDILISLTLLTALFPLMALTALLIKLDSPGSIVYSQMRTGLHCRPFRVYKFRSMYRDAEKRGVAQWASERDPRITRVGHWLRLFRIDELPQLWNVLRGDMSLIGPRPERPEIDAQLSIAIPYYDIRYLVKPGITGWAQVLYPYGASVKDSFEKLSFDIYYIKNYSLLLDLAIILKTLRVVLLGKGR